MYEVSVDEAISEKLFNGKIEVHLPQISAVKIKVCNICSCSYVQNSRFDRFCESCRNSNELFKYEEWGK